KPPRARAGDVALDELPACHRIQAGKWFAKRKERDKELYQEKHKMQAGSPFCVHVRNMRVQIGGNLLGGYRFTLALYEYLRERDDRAQFPGRKEGPSSGALGSGGVCIRRDASHHRRPPGAPGRFLRSTIR